MILPCRLSAAVLFASFLFCSGCQTPQGSATNKKSAAATGKKGKKGSPGSDQESQEWEMANAARLATGPLGKKDSYGRVETNLPLLALTFDDGPHPSNTPRLLDIMKARNVKATFYVVGTNVRAYPEIMRRIISEGHEIGNHTVTHGDLTKMSDDGVRRELKMAHDAIMEATGVAPRSMRPPYGAITSRQKTWIKQEFGYPSILWSVDPEDWKKPGSAVVTNRLVSGASPGGILLVHDIHKPTIDAIPSALDQLLSKGYQFVTVSQLIALEDRG